MFIFKLRSFFSNASYHHLGFGSILNVVLARREAKPGLRCRKPNLSVAPEHLRVILPTPVRGYSGYKRRDHDHYICNTSRCAPVVQIKMIQLTLVKAGHRRVESQADEDLGFVFLRKFLPPSLKTKRDDVSNRRIPFFPVVDAVGSADYNLRYQTARRTPVDSC